VRFRNPCSSNVCTADIKIHDGVANKSVLNSGRPEYKSLNIKLGYPEKKFAKNDSIVTVVRLQTG